MLDNEILDLTIENGVETEVETAHEIRDKMNFAILTVEDALISHDTHDYHRAPRVSFQLPDLPEEEYSSDSPHTETSIIDDRRPTLSTTSTAATIPIQR